MSELLTRTPGSQEGCEVHETPIMTIGSAFFHACVVRINVDPLTMKDFQ